MQKGMVSGIFGCVFGILGILTLGVVFVPLAALCAVISLLRGIGGGGLASIGVSLLAGVLVVIGFATSPGLWLALALVAVAPVATSSVAPSPVQPVPTAIQTAVSPTDAEGPAAMAPADTSFEMGKRDRMEWEQFVARATGEERDGANWWASQRSLKAPGSCSFGRTEAFRNGCQEAQIILNPADISRKSNAAYRVGWNSF